MSEQPDESDRERRPPPARLPEEGVVYVAPGSLFADPSGDSVTLPELWRIVWSRKGTIVVVTLLFAMASVVYALLAEEIYRSEVLLMPSDEQSSPVVGGQLGGLAALAGVDVGRGDQRVEALAVLRSRDFAREFIADYNLLPVFFADRWDENAQRWVVENPDDAPDLRDGVRYFHKSVYDVEEDSSTGLVTLSIEWHDPDTAALWAEALVGRVNDRLRERALQEAQTNVSYLQAEMGRTSLVAMQQSIGQLLQTEMQKLMLARGNEEFAFKVVDPAVPPKERERPKRTLIVILGTLLGGALSVAGVLLAGVGRRADAA
ncbi:MAG: Wzz/FepE/Etk N-terminal domain-containing protein [Gammaproteobacteria bacterium]